MGVRRNNEWYEANKDVIIAMYNEGSCSLSDIAKKLECGRSGIIYKLKEWNVPKRPRIKYETRYNAIYNVDYHYFDNIDDEHKAYWLGMLLSDGFVNNREISLRLQKCDKEIVEMFKNDLKAEHPIKTNSYGAATLTITSHDMCNTLMEYGFHNKKSYNFNLDKLLRVISNEYENHFVRGLFDGDGSVKYYKYDYQKTPFFHLGYTGLLNVCEYVDSKFEIGTFIDEGNNLTYTLRTHNPKKIIDIYDYLYKDATIYLSRKYNTFQEIIEIEKARDELYMENGVKANVNRDRCRYITYNNETHSLKEWAEIRGINYGTLSNRINSYHWNIGRALEYE
jgi:hypothetical protein